ncbi:MAG: hypothetical protein ACUVV4_01980 [Candidatus Bathyarchaeia archaeon]
MGPATRGGCEALCIKANMPCSGVEALALRLMSRGLQRSLPYLLF